MIRRRLGPIKVALLFGSEKVGLSNNDLSYCHWLMRIPTRTEHRSMNLGQSVAICLYELIRNRAVPVVVPAPEKQIARADEVERLTDVLFDILRQTRYWNPGAGKSTEEKVRRLVRRLRLDAGDTEVLLGMLRQITWKLRTQDRAPD